MYVICTTATSRQNPAWGEVTKTLCRDGVFREAGCDPYYFRKWKTEAGAQRNADKIKKRSVWIQSI